MREIAAVLFLFLFFIHLFNFFLYVCVAIFPRLFGTTFMTENLFLELEHTLEHRA